MWSKAEEKTMFARYQTCCTNSTEGAIHGRSIWKNQTIRTLQKHHQQQQAYLLPEKVLVFSDGK